MLHVIKILGYIHIPILTVDPPPIKPHTSKSFLISFNTISSI
jgi:hypothetical protein